MTDLAWRNRRVIARRTGWPEGVLEECERLDGEHPGWSVWWLPEKTCGSFQSPAGFSATMPAGRPQQRRGGGWMRPNVFATSVPELVEAMAEMEQRLAQQEANEERLWRSMR